MQKAKMRLVKLVIFVLTVTFLSARMWVVSAEESEPGSGTSWDGIQAKINAATEGTVIDLSALSTPADTYLFTVGSNKTLTLKGNGTEIQNVAIVFGENNSITIENLNIKSADCHKDSKTNDVGYSPLHFTGIGNTLTLVGNNTITSGQTSTADNANYGAAVGVPAGAALTIAADGDTSGNLTATGGYCGAGIGGGSGPVYVLGGSITITSGTVVATSGSGGAAGIGGGWAGDGGTVTINGGSVKATSTSGGAGIGGGYNRDGANITISGGTVEAIGGNNGAGIGGGGNGGSGGSTTISGGSVKAVGGDAGAGIGGGNSGSGGSIIISGGTVEAFGGNMGAGIGGGLSGGGGSITISGGTVDARGNFNSAGIGGGAGGAGGNITISGGTVNASGGEGQHGGTRGGAGIGGGENGNGGSIIITGGSVKAAGYGGGKDIGAGDNGSNDGTLKNDADKDVYLNTVTISDKADKNVTAAGYGENVYYGENDVKTDTDGKLYFYLPASDEDEFVDVTVDGTAYTAEYTRQNDHLNAQSMQRSIKNAEITLTNPVYTGEALTPLVTVQDGGKTLTEGTDYTVSYSDNTNAGTAIVNITGKDNYPGIVSKDFIIEKADAPTGVHQTLEAAANREKNYDFDLTTLLPAVSGTLGTVTYTPIIILNDDGILGTLAYTSGDTLIIPVQSVASAEKSAIVQVTVSSTNYKDFFANISVTVEKQDSGGSYNVVVPAPKYQAEVSGGKVEITVDTETGSASVKIEPDRFAGETTVIIMPEIPDVTRYQVSLPTGSISGKEGGEITVSTSAGTLTISSNMLDDAGTTGEEAQLSIGTVQPDTLSDEARAAVGNRPVVSLSLTLDGQATAWNNPDAPVTVGIPYTPTAYELENPENLVVWYIDGTGNLTQVSNAKYDAETGMITFTTTHFSCYAVGYLAFTDVLPAAWYFEAVNFVAEKGIATGTGNGEFSPDTTLTRGQLITMLMQAYGIEADENAIDNFSDAGNTYYTSYLAAAKRLGISGGVGDNRFAPELAVTRQEMFTLLHNTLKVIGKLPEGTGGKPLSAFADAESIAFWAEEAITVLVETGAIRGNEDMLFPTKTSARAEVAQVLFSLLSK